MSEELNVRSELSQKLDGNVAWEPGDTEHSYMNKTTDYYLERNAGILAGEPTWWRWGFDANIGASYSFYRDGKKVGTVVVDEQDCEVYDADDGPNGPQPVASQPGLRLAEAVSILEAYGL